MTSHTTHVQREGSIGGFAAYRALCNVCGPLGPRYVAAHAAQGVADDHTAQPFKRTQVKYQYHEVGTGAVIPGIVVWATSDVSRAIDLTIETLEQDENVAASPRFVILDTKAIA